MNNFHYCFIFRTVRTQCYIEYYHLRGVLQRPVMVINFNATHSAVTFNITIQQVLVYHYVDLPYTVISLLYNLF